MTICSFHQRGYCKFGDNCRFQHVDSVQGQNRGFGAGGDRNYRNQYQNQNQNAFSVLGTDQGNTGGRSPQQGAGGQAKEPTIGEILATIEQEMGIWENSKMWPFSCFSYAKEIPSLPGMVDHSPEEVRWKAYEANATGQADAYKKWITDLKAEYAEKQKVLRRPTPEQKTHMIQLLKNMTKPSTQSSGGSTLTGLLGDKPATGGTSSVFGGSAFSSPQASNKPSAFGGNSSVFGAGSIASANPVVAPSAFGGGGGGTTNSGIFGGASTTNQTTSSVFGGLGGSAQTQPTGGLFGKPAQSQSSSVFGGAAQIGQNTGVFGGQAGQTSAFGGAAQVGQTSAFGGAGQVGQMGQAGSVFGGNATKPLGSGLFGSQPSGGLFGSQVASSTSAFGGQATTTQSAFGAQPSTTSAFGAQASTTTSGVFGGQPATNPSAFGGQQASTTTSAFGQPSAFGAQPSTTSAFGAQPPTTSSAPPFGSQPTQPAGTGLFGKPAAVGATATNPNPGPGLFGKAPGVFGGNPMGGSSTGVYGGNVGGSSGIFGVGGSSGGVFGGGSGHSGASASIPDHVYTSIDKLTLEEKAAYEADAFDLDKLPMQPPPRELCV